MSDAMVTGRMSSAKKRAGNRVLRSLGVTASQAINQLYDHLIEQESLPFDSQQDKAISPQEREEARLFVRSLPRRNRFSDMTDEQIKQTRLADLVGSSSSSVGGSASQAQGVYAARR